MIKKDEITTDNTISRTSNDCISNQQPIVCAYACVPEWSQDIRKYFGQTTTTKKVVPNMEKIQQLINEISVLSQKVGRIDAIIEKGNDIFSIIYNNGVSTKEIFSTSADTEIADSIIELIKGYYELEINKKKEELQECLK